MKPAPGRALEASRLTPRVPLADFRRISDGAVCLTDVECASGHCSQLTGCYSPWSVAAGGACGADLQCASGQRVQAVAGTIGYCGCAGQDWL